MNNFQQPPVSERIFETEKRIIAQEKQEAKEDIFKLHTDSLYAHTPLAFDVFGDLEKVTYDMYTQYRQKYYNPNQAHLLIISPDTSKIALTPHLDTDFSFDSYPEILPHRHNSLMTNNTSESVEVLLGYGLSRLSPQILPVGAVLKTALANFWTSVLIYQLRVKHNIIYWIHSYSHFYANLYDISLYYKTDTNTLIKSLQIIQESLQNLEKLITPEDIERYKTMFISDSKTEDSNIYDIQSFYGFQLLSQPGISQTPQNFYAQVQLVSYQQVLDLMQTLLASPIKSLLAKDDLNQAIWQKAQQLI